MPYKFTVSFDGEAPDNMSGDQLIQQLAQNVKSLPFKLLLQTIDTSSTGLINAPIKPKSSVEDWDNEKRSWQ
jgi:hypothetical protein